MNDGLDIAGVDQTMAAARVWQYRYRGVAGYSIRCN